MSSNPSRAGARLLRALAIALVVVGCGAFAASAGAARVLIVTHDSPPEVIPKKVLYFGTIQSAVDASKQGDYILIAPGTYKEQVVVEKPHTGIWIRGMDRNNVILDGEHKVGNGIEIYKDNNVWVENLTVRNFDEGAGCTRPNGCGNGIWWNGGGGSGKIGSKGWFGSYLTAYQTDLLGGYGIFTNNERRGEWHNIYASGFNDSGMYLGACQECEAVINEPTMENNSLGYSGSNSGGQLIIENGVFRNNAAGIAPNGENPGDGPPPNNGACVHGPPWTNPTKKRHKLPVFESTEIAHCGIIRNNLVENNGNTTPPTNGSTEVAPFGVGIEMPGVYGYLVEGNTIVGNPSNGVLGFEYPNPFPITEETIFFQFAGNAFKNNAFHYNGYMGTPGNAYGFTPESNFTGDMTWAGGLFGQQLSTQNCASGNTFGGEFGHTTFPTNLEGTWGCQNKTTPNPNLGYPGIFYIEELSGYMKAARTPTPQPVPPAQTTMPNPCVNVPVSNQLCP